MPVSKQKAVDRNSTGLASKRLKRQFLISLLSLFAIVPSKSAMARNISEDEVQRLSVNNSKICKEISRAYAASYFADGHPERPLKDSLSKMENSDIHYVKQEDYHYTNAFGFTQVGIKNLSDAAGRQGQSVVLLEKFQGDRHPRAPCYPGKARGVAE